MSYKKQEDDDIDKYDVELDSEDEEDPDDANEIDDDGDYLSGRRPKRYQNNSIRDNQNIATTATAITIKKYLEMYVSPPPPPPPPPTSPPLSRHILSDRALSVESYRSTRSPTRPMNPTKAVSSRGREEVHNMNNPQASSGDLFSREEVQQLIKILPSVLGFVTSGLTYSVRMDQLYLAEDVENYRICPSPPALGVDEKGNE